jgi:hypothetical protein
MSFPFFSRYLARYRAFAVTSVSLEVCRKNSSMARLARSDGNTGKSF